MPMNKKTNKRKENNGITSIKDGRNADVGLKKNPKPARMANLELLRCVAMMMVIVLHYLGKGACCPT